MTQPMMLGLLSLQGSAIATTAICSYCFDTDSAQRIVAQCSEPYKDGFSDVTSNEQMDCTVCGRRGGTLDFSIPYDENIRTPNDIPEPIGHPRDYEGVGTDPFTRNRYRASRAGVALKAYSEPYGDSNDPGTQIQDMLSDLLHLCDWLDVSLDGVLNTARSRYEEEVQGE